MTNPVTRLSGTRAHEGAGDPRAMLAVPGRRGREIYAKHLRTVMNGRIRNTLVMGLWLLAATTSCDKKKAPAPAAASSASPVAASPVGSVLTWSPPRACTNLAACQKQCEACGDSCNPKDAAACNDLGDLLLRDELGQFDVTAAAKAYDSACRGGNMPGCSALAIQVQDGRGVERDIARAISLYEKSCKGGVGVGCYNLGLMYLHGGGGVVDEQKATASFEKAREKYQVQCDAGDLQWCMNLGVIYENGHGVPPDPARATEIYESACKKGHGDSCVNLALSKFSEGTQNAGPELRLLEARCNAGTVLACGVLGQIFTRGGAGVPPDPKRAATLLERACTGGSGHACSTLGALYALGQALPRDPKAATRFSDRACSMGISSSCTALGSDAAENGVWGEARKYLQQGCWIGDGEACARLAVLVQEGKGGEPDEKAALALITEACRMGQGVSCMDLFKRKAPIPLPDERKKQLFTAACKRGYQEACAALGI